MAQSELPRPYQPNPLLGVLLDRLFSSLQPEPSWLALQRRVASEGIVVHVLQALNAFEFLALDHVTKQHSLPRIQYVNDLGLWVLNPMGKGWLNALLPQRRRPPTEELVDALTQGGSAALFVKRRAGVMDVATSGTRIRSTQPKEGDQLVRALFDLQRRSQRPIQLIPELFLWSTHPERGAPRARDLLLGPPETPSAPWAVAHLLTSSSVHLRAGEPLNLAEFLELNAGLSEEALVRRLVYSLLRRFSRERRAVAGPAVKPPDRIRSELLRSPRVRELIDDLAAGDPIEAERLRAKALENLRQLQATPDYNTARLLAGAVRWLFHWIYAGIEIDRADLERIRQVARQGTVVLLPSHKSHIDYLVVSYQFNRMDMPIPIIAAGDNLDFFPMGPLFRRSGAFFIRRSFKGDRLYAAVVDVYIRRLIRDAFPLEVFLEGTRSRTGKLLPPKLGLLSMIVDATLAESQRKTFFVPLSIGYERIVETDSFHREVTGGEKRKEDAVSLLRSRGVLRSRYGRINLQVGEILTLDQMRSELALEPAELRKPAKRRAIVSRLANRVMDEINRVTGVTPGALTALALLSHQVRGISHEELVRRCERFVELLRRSNARLTAATATPAGTLRREGIREAVQLFADGELVEIHATATVEQGQWPRPRGRTAAGAGAFYTVPDNKRLALDTSKNIVIHFFVERAVLALVLLDPTVSPLTVGEVRSRYLHLVEIFRHEFRLAHGDEAEQSVERLLAELVELGLLERQGDDRLGIGPGSSGATASQWLTMLAGVLVNYLEGYRITARSLSVLLEGPLSEKEFLRRALATGNRMFFSGEVSCREAVSKPILGNALLLFADRGVVELHDQQFSLSEGQRQQSRVDALEAEFVGLLHGVRS